MGTNTCTCNYQPFCVYQPPKIAAGGGVGVWPSQSIPRSIVTSAPGAILFQMTDKFCKIVTTFLLTTLTDNTALDVLNGKNHYVDIACQSHHHFNGSVLKSDA